MNLQKLFCVFIVTLVYFVTAENAVKKALARRGEQVSTVSTTSPDEGAVFLELGQSTSASSRIQALRSEIASSSSLDADVEEEFRREMELIKQKAREPFNFLQKPQENRAKADTPSSFMEASTQAKATVVRTGVVAEAQTYDHAEAPVFAEVDHFAQTTLRDLEKKYNPSSLDLSDYFLGTKKQKDAKAREHFQPVDKYYSFISTGATVSSTANQQTDVDIDVAQEHEHEHEQEHEHTTHADVDADTEAEVEETTHAGASDAAAFEAELRAMEQLMGATGTAKDSFAEMVAEVHKDMSAKTAVDDADAHMATHEAADEDVGDLFDFHEDSKTNTAVEETPVSLLEVSANAAATTATSTATATQAKAKVKKAPGNSPGWPFANPTARDNMYQAPTDTAAMPTGNGYSVGALHSLAQGTDQRFNNDLDMDDMYNNYNGLHGVASPHLNSGLPEDVLLRGAGAGVGAGSAGVVHNGYMNNAINQGSFIHTNNAYPIDPSSLSPQPDITNLRHGQQLAPNTETDANSRYYQQPALLESQKVTVPYFPKTSPLPLAPSQEPAPYSTMQAHGTVAQFTPSPMDAMPTSAMSQDAVIALGHTGHLPSPTVNGQQGTVSPFALGSSFLAQPAQPAAAPGYTTGAAYQDQQTGMLASQPGYFPGAQPQAHVSPAYTQSVGLSHGSPMPGSIPSFYPVDNMALNTPIHPYTSVAPTPTPYGPYSTYSPAHSVNSVEVNPELHPVQYMADTPYFPTDSIGDDVLPPAPIEQPVHPSGPVAGMLNPRLQPYGNIYVPSAPYAYEG